MRLPLSQIAEYVRGSFLVEASDPFAVADDITWDSREVEPGCVYVALPGERVDGHSFAADALTAGAVALIVSHSLGETTDAQARECGAAVILVDDTYNAVRDLAAGWRSHLSGEVLALTGSSGKTTTKNLIRDVLAAQFSVVATRANQNNELGVPRTLLRASESTRYIVVEMGMRGAGQLSTLCEFVKPTMALITNVGESHIELLGSRENIARAKAEVLQALPDGKGRAFLNVTDEYTPFVRQLAALDDRKIKVVTFDGAEHESAVYATDVELDDDGCPRFTLVTPTGSAQCHMQLRGMHTVHNACAAAAVGASCGMDAADIAEALEHSQPVAGRQEVLHTSSGVTVIDDSYNANPDSMRASLSMFCALGIGGRRIAILGDMGELGDYSLDAHCAMGSLVATLPLDRLICVGPLSRDMARAAIEGGMDESCVQCVDSAQQVMPLINGTLTSGDAVLVKASHSVGLEQVVKDLVN